MAIASPWRSSFIAFCITSNNVSAMLSIHVSRSKFMSMVLVRKGRFVATGNRSARDYVFNVIRRFEFFTRLHQLLDDRFLVFVIPKVLPISRGVCYIGNVAHGSLVGKLAQTASHSVLINPSQSPSILEEIIQSMSSISCSLAVSNSS